MFNTFREKIICKLKGHLATQVLPEERRISFVEFVSCCSIWEIMLIGISLYVLPVIVTSVIEGLFIYADNPVIYIGDYAAGMWDLIYFNFVTIITIGYGDVHPISWGRFLSVLEGILGVGIFGVLVAAVTTKLLTARHDSIVFSRYGYYCTDEQRFLLIFVNTTHSYIFNVDMTSYFKLGGDWRVRSSIRTPFITTSVQTFYLDEKSLEEIVELLREGDVFRFGVSGSIGLSRYSAAVEYHADEIIVIPNREELTCYRGFHSPDFKTNISEMFHYRPAWSSTLAEYVNCLRRKRAEVKSTERPL